MGLGESKDNKELKLFPEEERLQLEKNFEKLSKGNKNKVDRQTLEVSLVYKFSVTSCKIPITTYSCFN
jgi:hypothetical protein